MDEYYLFLDSDMSKEYYPENEPAHFVVELPRPYQLGTGWCVGLKDIKTSVKEDLLYVCSDVCEESYAENTMLPVLRALQKPTRRGTTSYFSFDNPMYMKIKPTTLNRIRIFLLNGSLNKPNIKDSKIRCTIHLKKWT